MSVSATEAPVDERPAAALRLMMAAQIAIVCCTLVSRQLFYLSGQRILGSDPLASRALDVLGFLITAVPFGIMAWSLMRFTSLLGDGPARRWGLVASVLSGVTAVWCLAVGVFPWTGVEQSTSSRLLFLVFNLLEAAGNAAILMTVWKSAQVLALRPPAGVLGFTAAAIGLYGVARLVSFLLWQPFVPGDDPMVVVIRANVTGGLSLVTHILLAGALCMVWAERRGQKDNSAGGFAWTSAAAGLRLYTVGLYAFAAAHIAVQAMPLLYELDSVSQELIQGLQAFVHLLGLGFLAMILTGLSRYASLWELGRARGYVYANLALLTLMESAETFGMTFRFPLVLVALPPSFVLLSGSFHKVAQVLGEQELAHLAKRTAFWLFVPSAVSAVLRASGLVPGLERLASFVAAVSVLYGLVLFLRASGRLRQRMSHGATSPSPAAGPLFANS